MRLVTTALVLMAVAATTTAAKLTILTPHGYVQFWAADDWPVVGSQTKLPVAVMGFQIPDSADEGTNDSTNLAVSLYDQNSVKGQEAMKLVGRRYGSAEPTVTRVGEWKVFEQRAFQGKTEYTILDALRPIADVTASVRLAWPHLAKQGLGHDARMREIFTNTINSFRGGLGTYKPQPDEVVRRPKP